MLHRILCIASKYCRKENSLDRNSRIVYNEDMNTNLEIYNYLNITNRRLGRLYKVSGISNLPSDFVIDKEKIKERLSLNRMGDDAVLPNFIFNDKKTIKKHFKNSLKNCKKILKNRALFDGFEKDFATKVEIYIDMRISLTKMILKDFGALDFDESEAYQDIYNLNPILSQLLGGLFEDKIDEKALFVNLDKAYEVSYLEKLQTLEKLNKKKKQKDMSLQGKTAEKSREKSKQASKKVDHALGKEMEKNIQNKKKMQKKQQISVAKQQIKQKQNKEK